jgi:hypothetical protein
MFFFPFLSFFRLSVRQVETEEAHSRNWETKYGWLPPLYATLREKQGDVYTRRNQGTLLYSTLISCETTAVLPP